MRFSSRSKLSILFSFLAIAAVVGGFVATGAIRGYISSAHASAAPMHINCASGSPICSEVYDSEAVFGQDVYVGHDEPSVLFYTATPGGGQTTRYNDFRQILSKNPC